ADVPTGRPPPSPHQIVQPHSPLLHFPVPTPEYILRSHGQIAHNPCAAVPQGNHGHVHPTISIAPLTYTPLCDGRDIIWIPPDFLPDHTEAEMCVPLADNADKYQSMVKILELIALASAGRKREEQYLSYILEALRNNYGFTQLSVDIRLKFHFIPASDLAALKVYIKQSLDEHNKKFFILDPKRNNPPEPSAGPTLMQKGLD
ncbi:hypothetical protein H0H93_010981, partial [Arthromyces matolae]